VAVYHQGTIAGCGLLECRTSAEPVHEMRYHCGVHPAYRGQGLGGRIALVGTRRAGRNRGIASALLRRALTGARAAGFASASLGVDADSPTGALGLYQRAGFTMMLTSVTNTKPLLAVEPGGTPPGGH
jgi:ribosomal protein S18 acetylase RimI-like enzyme